MNILSWYFYLLSISYIVVLLISFENYSCILYNMLRLLFCLIMCKILFSHYWEIFCIIWKLIIFFVNIHLYLRSSNFSASLLLKLVSWSDIITESQKLQLYWTRLAESAFYVIGLVCPSVCPSVRPSMFCYLPLSDLCKILHEVGVNEMRKVTRKELWKNILIRGLRRI